MQTNTRLHKYSTRVTPLSTWLCGKLLVPVIKTKPKRKWCKWNLTKEIILCMRVSSSSSRLRCCQTSCTPYASGAQSENSSCVCAHLCGHFRLGQSKRGFSASWNLPVIKPDHVFRFRTLAITKTTAEGECFFSSPAYMQQIRFSFAETQDGACAAVSSVIRLLKPCNSISGHPTHSGSRGRNVSPRNCSVSGPCEIPVCL